METRMSIEEKIGEAIKQDCKDRGVCMENYDPSTQTYTPWYKLPIKIEFGKMHPGSYGKFNIWKRKMKIDPTQGNPAATLYHEVLHADVAPLTNGIKLATIGGMLYSAYEGLCPEVHAATQTLPPIAKSLLGFGIILAVRRGEEYIVRLRERSIFGGKK